MDSSNDSEVKCYEPQFKCCNLRSCEIVWCFETTHCNRHEITTNSFSMIVFPVFWYLLATSVAADRSSTKAMEFNMYTSTLLENLLFSGHSNAYVGGASLRSSAGITIYLINCRFEAALTAYSNSGEAVYYYYYYYARPPFRAARSIRLRSSSFFFSFSLRHALIIIICLLPSVPRSISA